MNVKWTYESVWRRSVRLYWSSSCLGEHKGDVQLLRMCHSSMEGKYEPWAHFIYSTDVASLSERLIRGFLELLIDKGRKQEFLTSTHNTHPQFFPDISMVIGPQPMSSQIYTGSTGEVSFASLKWFLSTGWQFNSGNPPPFLPMCESWGRCKGLSSSVLFNLFFWWTLVRCN